MQYAKDFTDALQFMWGDGFLSPGGPEEVAEMVAGIDLTGKRVLDVGSGLGGVDILLATKHGAAEVVGIDVEPQLVQSARALISAKGLAERVTFQLVEPGPLPFPDASFDVVFSKDAMVHIEDKASALCRSAPRAEAGRLVHRRGLAVGRGRRQEPDRRSLALDWPSQVHLHAAAGRAAGHDQGGVRGPPHHRSSFAAATIQQEGDRGAGGTGAPATGSNRRRDDGQQPAGQRKRPTRCPRFRRPHSEPPARQAAIAVRLAAATAVATARADAKS